MREPGTNILRLARHGAAAGVCAALLAVPPPLAAGASPAPRGQQAGPPPRSAQSVPVPAPRSKKLVLKDGSYHLVRSYEKKGDRVRFYSVERSAWEEIPADMVDWAATEKADAEHAAREAELHERLKSAKQNQIAAEVDVDSSIEVAPGVFLPDKPGLYIVEDGQTRDMDVAALEMKRSAGRTLARILVPISVIPARHRLELAGARAVLRLRTPTPEFFVRTEDKREPEMELVRTKVKGKSRQVEFVDTIVTGERFRSRDAIGLQRWQVARGVFRLTLSQSLEPGEFVLMEILPDDQLSTAVWDFGVDRGVGAPPQPKPAKPPKK
jgi:hypothetical protein